MPRIRFALSAEVEVRRGGNRLSISAGTNASTTSTSGLASQMVPCVFGLPHLSSAPSPFLTRSLCHQGILLSSDVQVCRRYLVRLNQVSPPHLWMTLEKELIEVSSLFDIMSARDNEQKRPSLDYRANPFALLIPPDQPLPPELYVSLYDRLSTRWNQKADTLVAHEEFRNTFEPALPGHSKKRSFEAAMSESDEQLAEKRARFQRSGLSTSDTTIETLGSAHGGQCGRRRKSSTGGTTPPLSRSVSWPLPKRAGHDVRTSDDEVTQVTAHLMQERRPSQRAEGLLRVVKSFENVLTVRAQTWRGLGRLQDDTAQPSVSGRRATVFAGSEQSYLPFQAPST